MSNEMFPLDQWYVVATRMEVEKGPVGRIICNIPVAAFQNDKGEIAVIEDVCPHRKYPLSAGKVVEGALQCGYHGIRMNGQGKCVHIPSQENIPPSLKVRAFPTIVKYDYVFAWMGVAENANENLIPDLSHNTKDGWVAVHGYLKVKSNYMLMVDNLLDLTHIPYTHPNTLRGDGADKFPLEVRAEGNFVQAERLIYDIPIAPMHARLTDFKTDRADRRQIMEFRPPCYVHVLSYGRDAGQTGPFEVPSHVIVNCLVPETDGSCHYFYAVSRCNKTDDTELTEYLGKMHVLAFGEDVVAVGLQQEGIDNDPVKERPLVFLDADKASAHARRIVRNLVAGERKMAAE